MDPVLWLSVATFGVLSGIMVAGYVLYRRITHRLAPILSLMALNADPVAGLVQRVHAWAFTQSTNEAGQTVYTSSPAFREVVSRLMPELIGQGMAWVKENVKFKPGEAGAFGGASGVLGAGAPEFLKQLGIPREWRAIAQMLIQYGPKLLGQFGAGVKKEEGYPPFPEALRKK